MAIVVVKTRKQMQQDDPLITHRTDGSLTREGALIEARALWGDLGTISSDDRFPRFVWCIGRFDATVGKGRSWEDALRRSKRRKEKLDQRELAKMWQEAATIAVETPVERVVVHSNPEE